MTRPRLTLRFSLRVRPMADWLRRLAEGAGLLLATLAVLLIMAVAGLLLQFLLSAPGLLLAGLWLTFH